MAGVFIDPETRRGNQRQMWAIETADSEFPTVQSLIEFLMKRADALDSVKSYPRKPIAPTRSVTKAFITSARPCTVCKNEYHPLYQCPKFREWTVEQRRELIKTENHRFNCFNQSHSVFQCNPKSRCHFCKRIHNSLLHIASTANHSTNENQPKSDQSASVNCSAVTKPLPISNYHKRESSCQHTIQSIHPAILPTATVRVRDKHGQYQLCQVLLDSGSETSLITDAFVQKLGLERRNGRISIQGLAKQKFVTTQGIVDLEVAPHFRSDYTSGVSAYVVPYITTITTGRRAELSKHQVLSSLLLADTSLKSAAKIDLLLGADKFFEILKPEQLKDSNNVIYAHSTHLGWLLTGNVPRSEKNRRCNTISIDYASLDRTLKRFWETEKIFRSAPMLPEDQMCEDLFKRTTTKLSDNHYMVRLPFKEERNQMIGSLGIAIKRLHGMERKFRKDPKFHERYVEFMEEYSQLKHMVEVHPPTDSEDYLYLPHHGISKETSATTKLRVVFDASAKTSSGYSLNDNLLKGPTLQNLLGDILIRFRAPKIVFTADAEKMYRQIWIHPHDLRYQRIVWRTTPEEALKHYELRTLTYGMSSAPYLATRVIHQIASEHSTTHPSMTPSIATYLMSKLQMEYKCFIHCPWFNDYNLDGIRTTQ